VAQPIINIFNLTVIIQVKELTRSDPHPEVEPAYSKRTAFRRDGCMGRAHIACHAPAPGEISPLGYFFGDAKFFSSPSETIRAGRCFLPGRSGIKADFNGLVDEMEWRKLYFSSFTSPKTTTTIC
jgi:hypothetical protein